MKLFAASSPAGTRPPRTPLSPTRAVHFGDDPRPNSEEHRKTAPFRLGRMPSEIRQGLPVTIGRRSRCQPRVSTASSDRRRRGMPDRAERSATRQPKASTGVWSRTPHPIRHHLHLATGTPGAVTAPRAPLKTYASSNPARAMLYVSSRPTMMWSRNFNPTACAPAAMRRVVSMSIFDGVSDPDGWLWATMMALLAV